MIHCTPLPKALVISGTLHLMHHLAVGGQDFQINCLWMPRSFRGYPNGHPSGRAMICSCLPSMYPHCTLQMVSKQRRKFKAAPSSNHLKPLRSQDRKLLGSQAWLHSFKHSKFCYEWQTILPYPAHILHQDWVHVQPQCPSLLFISRIHRTFEIQLKCRWLGMLMRYVALSISF